jgi:hypothetical protein
VKARGQLKVVPDDRLNHMSTEDHQEPTIDEKLLHLQCGFLFILYGLLRPGFQRIQLLGTIIQVHDSVAVYPRPVFQGLWDPNRIRLANLEPYIHPFYPLELHLFDYLVLERLRVFIDRHCECEKFLQPLCYCAILVLVWHKSNHGLYMRKQGGTRRPTIRWAGAS